MKIFIKNKYIKTICFIHILLYSCFSYSGTITVDSNFKNEALGLYSEYILDKQELLDINSVIRSNHFLSFKKPFQSFGYDNTIWLRFNLNNKIKNKPLYFELSYPLYDEIDIYILKDNSIYQHIRSGNLRPYKNRQITNKTFLFPLSFDIDLYTIFIKIKSPGYINIRSSLWNPDEFYKISKNQYILFFFYCGIVCLLSAFSFTAFIKTKETGYIFLSFVTINYLCWAGTILGYTIEYIFSSLTPIVKYIFLFFAFGISFFELQFFRNFLKFKDHFVILNRAINLLSIGPILCLLLIPIIKYGFLITVASKIAIFILLLQLILSLWLIKAKYKPVYYYMIAKIPIQLITLMNILSTYGYEFKFTPHYTWMLFAAVFESCFFSMSLSSKIGFTKGKKIEYNLYKEFIHDIESPILLNASLKGHLYSHDQEKQKTFESIADHLVMIYKNALERKQSLTVQRKEDITTYKNPSMLYSVVNTWVKNKSFEYQKESGIKFNFQFDPESLNTFSKINQTTLGRILSNLMNNSVLAIKLIGGTGNITVVLNASPQSIKITIVDTGCGMSQNVLKKIGTKGYSFGRPGTGIGIFKAKKLIENDGGTLSFSSTLGKGTKAVITLPRIPTPKYLKTIIHIKKGTNLVLFSCDPVIQNIFKNKLKNDIDTNLLSLQIHSSVPTNIQTLNNELYLIDDNIENKTFNFIEFIKNNKTYSQIILITNKYKNIFFLENFTGNEIFFIPNDIIDIISIKIDESFDKKEKKQFILIDDSPIIRMQWKKSANKYNVPFFAFTKIETFLSVLQQFDKTTTYICIDSNLGNEVPGELHANRFLEFGFKHVFLVTNYAPEDLREVDHNIKICGKNPLWETNNL